MTEIVQNVACPKCRETGHDTKGDHLIIFSDGNKYCNRSQFHITGFPYYEASNGIDAVTSSVINGRIKYTPKQFKELEEEGKLDSASTRKVALDGMRNKDAWEVYNDAERTEVQNNWNFDVQHFLRLSTRNLVSRGIRGEIALLYGVKVGLKDEKIIRHFYPHFGLNSQIEGASCRTLPKDFRFGNLGKCFGEQQMFGMSTMQAVAKSKQRMHTLLVTGGPEDAMAACQMLYDSNIGTKYEGQYQHVWSPLKGENCVEEVLRNREHFNKFQKIIWGFDADETGRKAVNACAKLFPGKSFVLKYPAGCKDANFCLLAGRSSEFIEAWWNPGDPHEGSRIKSIAQVADKLKAGLPEPGVSWPWEGLNRYTLGIRKHLLITIGAGSGVGKTEFLRKACYWLIEKHDQSVGIINTEDPFVKVCRSYIGKWINKKIELPACNDAADVMYRKITDYTEEDANGAIDKVASTGKLFVPDMDGDYSIQAVIAQIEELYLRGVENIIIDNLTGITLPSGKNKVEALDEAVKQLGVYKDTKPVTIFLVSHLSRVKDGRVPHEEGGDVRLSDFRGSGAIGFWSSYAIGLVRNTKAESLHERCLVKYVIVKDRDLGICTGEEVHCIGDEYTGDITELEKNKDGTYGHAINLQSSDDGRNGYTNSRRQVNDTYNLDTSNSDHSGDFSFTESARSIDTEGGIISDDF